jgi:hypothetical protein
MPSGQFPADLVRAETRMHHQQDVGDGDDDGHRPEDQRYDPEDVLRGYPDRVRVAWVEHRLLGVQRARPDIPEDHSESPDCEGGLGGSGPAYAHGFPSRRTEPASANPNEQSSQPAALPRRPRCRGDTTAAAVTQHATRKAALGRERRSRNRRCGD